MSVSIPTLHNINCWAVVTLGLTLNGLLIWLVKNRSTKEMNAYRRILLQTCFVDIFMIVIIGIVQPIYIVHNGYNTMISNGISSNFGHSLEFVFMMCWFFGLYFSILSNYVPVAYCYFQICWLKQMSMKVYNSLLSMCALLVLVFIAGFFWAAYPGESEMAMMTQAHDSYAKYMALDTSDEDFSIALVSKTDSGRWLLSCLYIIAVQSVCYTIISYCGLKLKEAMSRSTESGKETATGEVNRQLSCVLFWQFIMSLTEAGFTMVCMVTSLLPNKNVYSIAFGTMPLHWIPVLNPLITILVVEQYRDFFSASETEKKIH
ncbi:serpentine type 7TM GPCR chemoreceptor srd domain-containing protein [Ditylenchus destructor]|uniref:Serpentine type 7TM GPCR chemoreceptor srd domain-containing protein n=1 Tax=Ditylenchus destructor TaxID=166010 RepID=A0AAD4N1N3_9BILA|nr:serpentine type 7TM GPCR chemoreceptor srd domain-containing protein [Ditylenchus destructor]